MFGSRHMATPRPHVSLALAVWLVAGLCPVADAKSPATAGSVARSQAFDALDVDRNGTLSREEFQAGYLGLQRQITIQVQLRARFDALDGNQDGAIDAREYPQLELIKGAGKAAPPLSDFDIDHSRSLSFAEYGTLVRRLASQHVQQRK